MVLGVIDYWLAGLAVDVDVGWGWRLLNINIGPRFQLFNSLIAEIERTSQILGYW